MHQIHDSMLIPSAYSVRRRPSGVLDLILIRQQSVVNSLHLFRERCPLHHPDVQSFLYPRGIHCLP